MQQALQTLSAAAVTITHAYDGTHASLAAPPAELCLCATQFWSAGLGLLTTTVHVD